MNTKNKNLIKMSHTNHVRNHLIDPFIYLIFKKKKKKKVFRHFDLIFWPWKNFFFWNFKIVSKRSWGFRSDYPKKKWNRIFYGWENIITKRPKMTKKFWCLKIYRKKVKISQNTKSRCCLECWDWSSAISVYSKIDKKNGAPGPAGPIYLSNLSM